MTLPEASDSFLYAFCSQLRSPLHHLRIARGRRDGSVGGGVPDAPHSRVSAVASLPEGGVAIGDGGSSITTLLGKVVDRSVSFCYIDFRRFHTHVFGRDIGAFSIDEVRTFYFFM